MNKKLKKLFKNPKRFFWDSDKYRPILIKLNLENFFNDSVSSRFPEKLAVSGTRDLNEFNYLAEKFVFPGWEDFDLHGTNWCDFESKKPIAVMWGFNPWKRKFVSDYLPEYRTAYSRGNTSWKKLKNNLDSKEDFVFVIWGMSEKSEISAYAKERSIPIFRMEDGFIRSAALGSQYTVAHSLVLDKKGIYFDANNPSDLESILNDFDFLNSKEKLSTAKVLLNILRTLKISKYNIGSIHAPANLLGPKLRRRILVIGQVEGDASIKYGMAEEWTNQKLIDLACLENPLAEIIYKPHPDVLKGYRESSEKLEEIKEKCHLLSEDVMLADVFYEVDHVYTITSLSGFEALLHGVKVTVVGVPFYAGWGLTDDRSQLVIRRRRKLTVEELFCGAYLIYPRYLSSLENTALGVLAALLGISADRSLNINKLLIPEKIPALVYEIGASERWPILLRPENLPILSKTHQKKIASIISPPVIFSRCQGENFHRSIAYLLAGKFKNTVGFPALLQSLRNCIRPEIFSELIASLWRIHPSENLLMNWAWVAEKNGDINSAKRALNYAAVVGQYDLPEVNVQGGKKTPLQPTLELAQLELRQRNLDEACRLFNVLLLAGHVNGDIFKGLSDVARLRFDFSSAAQLLRVFNFIDPLWKKGAGQIREAQAQALIGNLKETIESMSIACKLNPAFTASIGTTLGFSNTLEYALQGFFGASHPFMDALVALIESEDGRNDFIARARALVANKDAISASDLLLSYTPRPEDRQKYCLMLSLSYRHQGDLNKSKSLILQVLPYFKTKAVYEEALEISVLKNEYSWGKELLEQVDSLELQVSEKYRRKIALGLRDIKACYLAYRNISQNNIPKLYLGDRYVQSLMCVEQKNDLKILIAACSGPGDEIRFGSLYGKMLNFIKDAKVDFTCDPRLYSMLKRSWPNIDFIPVGRVRSLDWIGDFSNYLELPGSDLHSIFDNSGWAVAKKSDNVILCTDALGDVIEGYESFDGVPYLKACEKRISEWKERLSDFGDKLLVGISWRSTLNSFNRVNDYLNVEDLASVFSLENIHFINLQYDECTEEIAWIERHFPGKISNFEDLDQFNDLEGVAALMSSLDLVIAPATTVVELAGALGCPTLLLSNASELHWRKLPGTNTDVWQKSITHVEGEVLGDKNSLSLALSEKIKDFAISV